MSDKKKKYTRRMRYVPDVVERTVETAYYADHVGQVLLKKTKSLYASRAAAKAMEKLHDQDYPGAMLAEVYDLVTSKLYAVVKMHVDGNVETVYSDLAGKRDYKDSLNKQRKKRK